MILILCLLTDWMSMTDCLQINGWLTWSWALRLSKPKWLPSLNWKSWDWTSCPNQVMKILKTASPATKVSGDALCGTNTSKKFWESMGSLILRLLSSVGFSSWIWHEKIQNTSGCQRWKGHWVNLIMKKELKEEWFSRDLSCHLLMLMMMTTAWKSLGELADWQSTVRRFLELSSPRTVHWHLRSWATWSSTIWSVSWTLWKGCREATKLLPTLWSVYGCPLRKRGLPSQHPRSWKQQNDAARGGKNVWDCDCQWHNFSNDDWQQQHTQVLFESLIHYFIV